MIKDDPEYKWIDKIRTTRASNEARQLLFLRLAASLQRKVGFSHPIDLSPLTKLHRCSWKLSYIVGNARFLKLARVSGLNLEARNPPSSPGG